MKNIKRLFCKHEYVLNWWRVIKAINSEQNPVMEAQYICKKCGKTKKIYGSELEMKKYPDDKLIL